MTTPDTDTPARAQTARDTDRAIAERLGYRVEQYTATKDKHHPSDVGKQYWRLMRGDEMLNWYRQFKFEAWEIPSGKWDGLPHYSTDLNAAMLLCAGISFYITSNGGNTNFPNNPAVWLGQGDGIPATSDAPADIARAICEAWLAYTATPAAPAGDE